jgi:hypothetical protein
MWWTAILLCLSSFSCVVFGVALLPRRLRRRVGMLLLPVEKRDSVPPFAGDAV